MTHDPAEIDVLVKAIGRLYGYNTTSMARGILDALQPFREKQVGAAVQAVLDEPWAEPPVPYHLFNWKQVWVDENGYHVKDIPDVAVYTGPPPQIVWSDVSDLTNFNTKQGYDDYHAEGRDHFPAPRIPAEIEEMQDRVTRTQADLIADAINDPNHRR